MTAFLAAWLLAVPSHPRPTLVDGEVQWGCLAIRRIVTGSTDNLPYARGRTPLPIPVTLLLLAGEGRATKRLRISVPPSCAIEGVRFVTEPDAEPEDVRGLAIRVEARGEGLADFDIWRLWLPLNHKKRSHSPASIERDKVLGLDTSR